MEGFPVYNFSWWEDYMSTMFLVVGFPEYNFPDKRISRVQFSWWKDFQSTIFLIEGFPEYNFSWWKDSQSTIFLIEGFPVYNFLLIEGFTEYNFPDRRISSAQFSWWKDFQSTIFLIFRGKLLVPDFFFFFCKFSCHFSTNQKIGSHFVCLARSPDTILEEYQIHICSSEEDQNVKS